MFAMFLIYSYSEEQKSKYDKRYGTTKTVLVATKDILEMSTIDETMVDQEEKPVDFIQPGAVENPDDAVGLVAATPIKKGEQLLMTKLLSPGPNTGLNVTNNIPRALQLDTFNGKPAYKNLNGDTGYSNITLEVNPVEAQNLIYIQSVAPGAIFLSLRNGNDKVVPRIPTSTLDTVLGVDSERALQKKLQQAQQVPPMAARPVKPQTFVEVRGSDVKY
ncbi:unnamed protein product [Sphagnum balticum]